MVIECLRYGSMKFLLPDGDGVNIQITPAQCGGRRTYSGTFGRTVSSIYNRSHPSLSGAGFAAFIEVVS